MCINDNTIDKLKIENELEDLEAPREGTDIELFKSAIDATIKVYRGMLEE